MPITRHWNQPWIGLALGIVLPLLVNLAARKLKGVDSQGMILLAEDADGKLVFVTPEQAVTNGVVVR